MSETERKDSPALMNGEPLPIQDSHLLSPDIVRQYAGKWIIYSADAGRVIGVGETLEEASDQAQASGVRGEWHYHHALNPEEWILGCL